MGWARGLAAALALLACRASVRAQDVPHDAGPPPVEPRDSGRAPSPDAEPPFTPWVRVTAVSGAVTVDPTLRVRREDLPLGAPGAARVGSGLYPRDTVLAGVGAELTLGLTPGGEAVLVGEGTLSLPGYAGASLVLTRGVVTLRSHGEAVRLDAPSGRVIVSSGEAVVGVAQDGAVLVLALAGHVTLWPTPPPPPPRDTRPSAAELAARRRAAGGHPISLDVELPELASRALRPVVSGALAPGASRTWTSLGIVGAPSSPVTARADVTRWVARHDALLARPGGHRGPIAWLSRAGSGDLADARVALARLRLGRDDARGTASAALSLALGRATARAHRGRELATRGGDATALVQLARLEELCESAWAVAPLVGASP